MPRPRAGHARPLQIPLGHSSLFTFRIFRIPGPTRRIFRDVSANSIHCGLITYHVIVIPPLPDRSGGCTFKIPDPFRHRGFVRPHDYADGTAPRSRAPDRIGDDYDSVNVVGHDNPFIQNHVRKVRRNSFPNVVGDPSRVIQMHRVIDNPAEQARPIARTYGYEIRIRLAVIEKPQTDGFTSWTGGGDCIDRHEIFDPCVWRGLGKNIVLPPANSAIPIKIHAGPRHISGSLVL